MNEMTINRTPDVIAVEINQIKAQTRTMMLCSSIEIGRRLVEAKGMVEHGQWGEWLEKQIDYSPRTAQNLMKIFEEYGADQLALFGDNAKTQTFADLTYSQAVALLGVPAEEREQFAETNKVDEMSTRELQQMIKERDDLQKKLDSEKLAATRLSEEKLTLKNKQAELKAELELGHRVATTQEDTIKQLRWDIEELKTGGGNEEKVSDLEAKLKEAETQVQALNQRLSEPITVDAKVVNASSTAVLKFGIHFEALVAGFQSLLADLAEIQETDPDKHDKYKNAVVGLIGKMTENL